MTEKSGSPPQSGQLPCGQPLKSVRAMIASAHVERNGRIACSSSGSSPATSREGSCPPAGTGAARLEPVADRSAQLFGIIARAPRRAGSRRLRSPRACASRPPIDRTRNRKSLQSIGTCSNARIGVPAASALSRCAASRFIDGSGTRDCTRRCTLEQLDLQVDGRRQLGLVVLQLPQLEDLARLGACRRRRLVQWFVHGLILVND